MYAQVHTLWDTHLAVCLDLGTCSCWHCTEPRPPGRRLVHSPSPDSERGKGRERDEEGEGGREGRGRRNYYTKLIKHA